MPEASGVVGAQLPRPGSSAFAQGYGGQVDPGYNNRLKLQRIVRLVRYARGGGVGRARDCGVDLGVGVALGVGVGVAVAVAVAVGVDVEVAVAVGLGVAVGVPP
jgi:hypothetical protein